MGAANKVLPKRKGGHSPDIWPYHPELLEKAVPRFTSYPPATAFHDGVGANDYREALEALKPGTHVSLYLHIPYCQQICYYCGCNTGAAGRKQRLDAYMDALDKEIEIVGGILGGRTKVKRIALGGGSPNAIEPVQFVRLLDRVATLFGTGDPLISVEIDPRNFSLDWALALSASRVSRVSFGVQTFAPHVQEAIGRVQPLAQIQDCVAGLRMRGISEINFDLMYGLPEQSLNDLITTAEQTIDMRPSRVALFGYAHLPDMIPRQRKIDGETLPDTRLRFEQAERGYELFTAAGYEPIGFDHFVLPDDSLAQAAKAGSIRRNFQGFTDDECDVLIGMGSSAISHFPDRIVQNEKHVGNYRNAISEGRLAQTRGFFRCDRDRALARLAEQLLCYHEAPVLPPLSMSDLVTTLPQSPVGEMIEFAPGKLRIRDGGRHYSRQIVRHVIGALT